MYTEAPGMIAPSLSSSRSVREAIKEVKMVQVCYLVMIQIWIATDLKICHAIAGYSEYISGLVLHVNIIQSS